MEIRAIRTKVFIEGEDLLNFIFKYTKKIPEGAVLVVTSKIVSLGEGRVVKANNKEKLVKEESDLYLNSKTWFTIKDGMVMAKAGVDESNGNGKLILLPRDSYQSAYMVRSALQKKFKLKNLGVIICDSNFLPMRAGAIGMALGYAGFKGIKNYVGKKDIFGRRLKVSTTNVADSLATVAVLTMGEGSEQRPLALITGAQVEFTKKVNRKEMKISAKKDIYAPLLNKFS